MKKVLIILGFIFLNFACSQEDLIEKGENAYKNKDYTNAIKYFQQACDLNNGNGCNELGTMYTLVKKNNFKAMESYQKACDLNYKQGCSNLGFMYMLGMRTKDDKFKAIELYEKACNLNEGSSCGVVGAMYANGTYVEKNDFKAVKFLKWTTQIAALTLAVCMKMAMVLEKIFLKL